MRSTASLFGTVARSCKVLKKEATSGTLLKSATNHHYFAQNYHQQLVLRNEKQVQPSSSSQTESQNPSVRVAKDLDYFLNKHRFERRYLSQQQQEHLGEMLSASSAEASPDQKATFEVGTKTPSESEVVIKLPFSTDSKLRDIYTNAFNGMRIGRLLEDLDAIAGEVAYKHSDGFDKRRPLTIVTAAIDRIELQKPIIPFFDLEIVGKVTFTGTSSMEIRIEVHSIKKDIPLNDSQLYKNTFTTGIANEQKELVMVAYFVMVALDKATNKSTKIHAVVPQNEDDKFLFEMGKENQARRKAMSESSLMKKPPSDEERLLIHDMFLQKMKQPHISNDYESTGPTIHYLSLDGGEPQACMPMSMTKQNNIMIMHPTNRNIHGKIFGGFLLREAYEIGFITAYMYTKHKPVFLALNENSFLKPVEVGSVVEFTSQIVYAGDKSLEIRVEVWVLDPPSGKKLQCNIFHFAFTCPIVHKVVPDTYAEAMLYLEGKRIHKKGKTMAELLNSKLAASYA
ncbi:hypothetical protein C9374_003486 [Naegleria lovaniensis]|uniref:HotDog ACOT-type domain-containing protein n=1 Tax=Naegleria lovaniensis TaxID=51637 RepID=A0AA88GTT4_NAELO|nr:uncharacterized protein C9374_003486 [Naegleria lovaniensis]KAG2385671.1 hypothetical protein C9374_003486 [Naegleria lovaniensis]